MGALKAFVIAMGVAIVALLTVIIVVIIMRTTSDDKPVLQPVEPPPSPPQITVEPPQVNVEVPVPEGPKPFTDTEIQLPEGGQIVDMVAAGDRMLIYVDIAGGNDQVMVIDLRSGEKLGGITFNAPGP